MVCPSILPNPLETIGRQRGVIFIRSLFLRKSMTATCTALQQTRVDRSGAQPPSSYTKPCVTDSPSFQSRCTRSYNETTGFEVPDTAYTPEIEREFLLPSPASLPCIYGDRGVPANFPIRTIASYLLGPLKTQIACPPIFTLPWHRVMEVGAVQALARAFEGRVVFLGANVSANTNDFFETAFHRNLPGVYLHALALKELFSRDRTLPVAAAIWERMLALVIPIMISLFLLLVIKGGLFPKLGRFKGPLSVSVGSLTMAFIYLFEGWKGETMLRDALFFAASCNIDVILLDPLQLASSELSRLREALLRDFDLK